MKSLIIGAAGFVGGHLVRHLSEEREYDVYVTKLPAETMNTAGVHAVYDLDILDEDAVYKLIDAVKPDEIYHLAAQSSVGLSWKKPQLTADINIKGTINVLEAVRRSNCTSKILLVGSGEEYGYVQPEDIPVNENVPLRAGNIYAATKACQGMLGEIYARGYNMNIIMVRAFNHIGPGQSDTFVVSDFCRQAVQIETGKRPPVISVGNLSAQRDFTDVRDIVRAYSLLMENGKSGQIYNVGSGKAVSIRSILDMIIDLSQTDITVNTDPSRLRPSDVPVIAADISKITADTSWMPVIPLKTTIADTLEYWRKTEL